MNKKNILYLIGLYLMFVVVKIVLSYFIITPTMFNDEYLFAKMARSFFYDFNLHVNGELLVWGRPLYPMILSISYLFKDMTNVYLVMKIINALLSSLVIFPAYLLAKEFFSRKKSILIAMLISVLPMNFAFSSYILSENLFYVLFLFSIYFIYKALNEDKFRWLIFSGLFIGLCNLTRIQGVIFFPLIIILFLVKKNIKSLFWILYFSAIVLAPYYFINVKYLGLNIKVLVGYGELVTRKVSFSLVSFVIWCLIYLSYVILASGFFAFLSKFDFRKKGVNLLLISLLSIIFLISMAALHSTTKPPELGTGTLGRYVDAIIPGILILGLFNLKECKKSLFLQSLVVFGFALLSFKLLSYSLFPVNHSMLSYLGVLNSIIGKFSFIFILGLFFSYFLIKRFTIKKIVWILISFFSIISLLCYGINYYNASYRWYNLDQVQAGLWLNEFDNNPNKTVFIENVDISQLPGNRLPRNQPLLRAGFWINGEIRFDTLESFKNADYVISINKPDKFSIIKEFGDVKISQKFI